MNGKRVVAVSGTGIDVACCSAEVLFRNPGAEVLATTPRCIAQTISGMAQEEAPPSEVHVCGVRVEGDWERLEEAAGDLRDGGAAIFWHGGRDFTEEDREAYEAIGIPVFVDCSSNAEAVSVTLRLTEEERVGDLLRIARADPEVEGSGSSLAEEVVAFWVDFIRAGGREYWRGLDRDRYGAVIRKLLSQKRDAGSEWAVRRYRRSVSKYGTIGTSDGMMRLRAAADRCSLVDDAAAVEGESCVEREEVARLIHENGRRALDPFVVVNCGRIGGDAALAGATLFGCVKGGDCGWRSAKAGALVAARDGTVFLDEIGLVPLEVQGKLLRALEAGEVVPEGAGGARAVRGRFIAGTSLDLAQMVREGYFLEDLFHRIGALRVVIPPLRRRRSDIPVIGERVLADLVRDGHSSDSGEADLSMLGGYDWPGNVPQLVKVIRRATYLEVPIEDAVEEERAASERADESGEGGGLLPGSAEEIRSLREIQREYAMRAWKVNGANTASTARALGISRNTLASYLAETTSRRPSSP